MALQYKFWSSRKTGNVFWGSGGGGGGVGGGGGGGEGEGGYCRQKQSNFCNLPIFLLINSLKTLTPQANSGEAGSRF